MYVRFVRSTLIAGMVARGGFFTAAGAPRRQPDIDPHSAIRVKDLLDWFRVNLAGFTKGLGGFKHEATEMLAKSRDLIVVRPDNGYPVETLRSARIGHVLYEDAHQIVAEPFSDTPA